jgi:hypothetical protein
MSVNYHVPIGRQQVSLVKTSQMWEPYASPNADLYRYRVLEPRIGRTRIGLQSAFYHAGSYARAVGS